MEYCGVAGVVIAAIRNPDEPAHAVQEMAKASSAFFQALIYERSEQVSRLECVLWGVNSSYPLLLPSPPPCPSCQKVMIQPINSFLALRRGCGSWAVLSCQ